MADEPDQIFTKLEPLAIAIDKALDSLHEALNEAKQQGCDLQILVDAIDDMPVPAVRIFRDGHAVWCGAEHLAGSGL
jgi:hypothetical protein